VKEHLHSAHLSNVFSQKLPKREERTRIGSICRKTDEEKGKKSKDIWFSMYDDLHPHNVSSPDRTRDERKYFFDVVSAK